MPLSIQYDASADAVFIDISDGVSTSTVIVSDDINVDLDEHGRLLSIEILSVSRVAPALAVRSISSVAAE